MRLGNSNFLFGFLGPDRNFFTFTGRGRGIATSLQNRKSAAIRITQNGSVMNIKLDRQGKRNAMNDQMWRTLPAAINTADKDSSTNLITISGHQDYFCAGTDLTEYRMAASSQFSPPESSILAFSTHVAHRLKSFAAAFIDCRKSIVVLVQGSAIGIGVTMLPLCDIVLASDKATFQTPFTSLGLTPNCCSSYTFPKIMGYAKTSRLLYLNEKITAEQAKNWGLVTEIISHKDFEIQAEERLEEISRLPIKALLHSKQLVRDRERKILHQVNSHESQIIEKMVQTPEMGRTSENFNMRKLKKYMLITDNG